MGGKPGLGEVGLEEGSGILQDKWKGLGRSDCIRQMGGPSLQHARGHRSELRCRSSELCGNWDKGSG